MNIQKINRLRRGNSLIVKSVLSEDKYPYTLNVIYNNINDILVIDKLEIVHRGKLLSTATGMLFMSELHKSIEYCSFTLNGNQSFENILVGKIDYIAMFNIDLNTSY